MKPNDIVAAFLKVDNDEYPSWFSASDRKLLKSVAKDDDTPHAVVAKDGSGDYSSIQEAIDAYPNKSNNQGFKTWKTTTFISFQTCKTLVTAIGIGFIAKSIGFVNTTGSDGHQVMAVRVTSNYSTLIVRKSNNNDEKYTVTAQVRSIRQQTATMVIHNCTIVPDEKFFPNSMGIVALFPKEVRGKRVKWSGAKGISKDQAQAYTVLKLLKSDQFLDDVGIPHDGLIYSNTYL
ncbi:hypothetical protein Patl1_19367 [Pistacia atlantica]|uniref:Uncharacterized protein n=1 Tax=Pistacia atlantica TaxID=434234 RepID=A0ACC1C1Q9_9ROSI|nr:hypothetical protein Patl1_19367 [Pistacia atlantica]